MRRGVVLAAALACLMVTILICSALAVTVVREHRALLRRQQQTQALWVAESAVSRARAQLRRNPEYAGETWTIPAADFAGRFPAKAVITLSADEENPSQVRLHVEAYYPDDPVNRILAKRELSIPISPAEETTPE